MATKQLIVSANKRKYDEWSKSKNDRWEIPSDHPGQNRKSCYDNVVKVSDGNYHSFYENYQKVNKQRIFYIIKHHHGFIHSNGMVGFECGYYMGREGCETRWGNEVHPWYEKCKKYLKTNDIPWNALWERQNKDNQLYLNSTTNQIHAITSVFNICSENSTIIPPIYKKVFTITALWDFNYYHFLADSLIRMSRHVKFLRKNPDIYIHVRAFEEYEFFLPPRDDVVKQKLRKMRDNFFDLLGLNVSRIIHGPILAEEVYIPRHTHCSFTLSNPYELRLLSQQLLMRAKLLKIDKDAWVIKGKNNKGNLKLSKVLSKNNKNIVIIQRFTTKSDYRPWESKEHGVDNTAALTENRKWTNEKVYAVKRDLQIQFPSHNIIIMNSSAEELVTYANRIDRYNNYNNNGCGIACELLILSNSDIIVGAHGAGLMNQIFMPPNSLVVEIVGFFDEVNMPVCGYYGTVAAVFGQHHFIYSYDWAEGVTLDTTELSIKSKLFYDHIHHNNTTQQIPSE
eukprot:gene7119-9715_t